MFVANGGKGPALSERDFDREMFRVRKLIETEAVRLRGPCAILFCFFSGGLLLFIGVWGGSDNWDIVSHPHTQKAQHPTHQQLITPDEPNTAGAVPDLKDLLFVCSLPQTPPSTPPPPPPPIR